MVFFQFPKKLLFREKLLLSLKKSWGPPITSLSFGKNLARAFLKLKIGGMPRMSKKYRENKKLAQVKIVKLIPKSHIPGNEANQKKKPFMKIV